VIRDNRKDSVLNLRQIEVFYAIMKSGSVSGAARMLHVSQPNVTRILSHTEQQLGFALFQRIKGRLVATEEARQLQPETEKIYQQLGNLHSLTNKIKKGSQHLRIGATPILATSLLTPTIANVCQDTSLSIELATDNRDGLCQSLIQNQLDLAICFGNNTPPAITSDYLLSDKMILVCHPNDATTLKSLQSNTVSLSKLLLNSVTPSPSIIGLDSRDPLGYALNQAIHQIDPSYQPQIVVRTYSAAAELVLQGAGIAIVDPWTATLYEGKLKQFKLETDISFSVSILFADHSPLNITAQQFVSKLRSNIIKAI
jgi:DNA-binding transcriptional LysR family regulator